MVPFYVHCVFRAVGHYVVGCLFNGIACVTCATAFCVKCLFVVYAAARRESKGCYFCLISP